MPRRASKSSRPEAPSTDCPRCGYDQSGVVASWADECPMAGVCSECGLEFEWGDVLNRSRVLLPWLYEHRRGFSFFHAPRTMFRVLLPWRFWGSVQMHHKLVVRRLVLYPLMMPAFIFVVTVIVGFGAFYLDWLPHRNGGVYVYPWMIDRLASMALYQFGYHYDSYSGITARYFNPRPIFAVGAMLGFSAGMSLVIYIAKSARLFSKMRMAHILRIGSYGMTLGMILYMLHASLWAWDMTDTNYSGHTQYVYINWSRAPHGRMIRSLLWDILLNGWVVFGGSLVWMAVWWWFAFRDGLQLESWRAVYVAGMCMGLVFAAFVMVNPSAWRWMYH